MDALVRVRLDNLLDVEADDVLGCGICPGQLIWTRSLLSTRILTHVGNLVFPREQEMGERFPFGMSTGLQGRRFRNSGTECKMRGARSPFIQQYIHADRYAHQFPLVSAPLVSTACLSTMAFPSKQRPDS